jgi:hypothetical protein
VCDIVIVSLVGYSLGFQTFQGLGPFLRILAAPFVVYLTKLPLVMTTFIFPKNRNYFSKLIYCFGLINK